MFEIGDHVEINAGLFIGETGVVTAIGSDGVCFIAADREPDVTFAVLASMIDPCGCPEAPPFGMSSQQTANEVGTFVEFCQARITGVGNEQYGQETHQQFETMDLDELIEYALEELADNVNYSVFMSIRLRRIQSALRDKL